MSDTQDLDRYVFCPPCGRQHAHMRDCPNATAWRCDCGAVRYTAAAVVAHLKMHPEVVEQPAGVQVPATVPRSMYLEAVYDARPYDERFA